MENEYFLDGKCLKKCMDHETYEKKDKKCLPNCPKEEEVWDSALKKCVQRCSEGQTWDKD